MFSTGTILAELRWRLIKRKRPAETIDVLIHARNRKKCFMQRK